MQTANHSSSFPASNDIHEEGGIRHFQIIIIPKSEKDVARTEVTDEECKHPCWNETRNISQSLQKL